MACLTILYHPQLPIFQKSLIDDGWWLFAPNRDTSRDNTTAHTLSFRRESAPADWQQGPSMIAGRCDGQRGLALRPVGVVGPELAAAALADWLFWGHGVGLSFAVFCVALTGGAHLTRLYRPRRRSVAALLILNFGLAPAVEHLGPLSVAFAIIATAAAAGLALPATPTISRIWLDVAVRWVAGPRRLCRDLGRYIVWRRRHRTLRAGLWTERLAWVVPLAAGVVFLALFADANPVVADLLSDIPWPTISLPTFAPRATFWLAVAVVVLPVVRPRHADHSRFRVAVAERDRETALKQLEIRRGTREAELAQERDIANKTAETRVETALAEQRAQQSEETAPPPARNGRHGRHPQGTTGQPEQGLGCQDA